jgi:exosortase
METGSATGIASFAKSDRIWLLVAAAVIGWVYWPGLVEMQARWSSDPRYSHGYLVPAFSAFLLWYRRDLIPDVKFQQNWWGLGLIALGSVLKLGGSLFFLGWFDSFSLVVMLAGLAVLAGGWPLLRWTLPSIAFLTFMIPLPYRVEWALGAPLQKVATISSTFALETLGLPAVAEGNVITMGRTRIGVVEACNGLGMLVMFFAYATAAVLLIKRPWLDKIVIMLSAIPIALLANISRITLTGLLHATVGGEWADRVYHDLAGWLMMPMALVTFWFVLKVLDWLFVEMAPVAEPAFVMAGHPSYKAKNPRPGA